MSLPDVLGRYSAARLAIRAAIQAQGVSVPSDAGFESFPDYIALIEGSEPVDTEPAAFASGQWTATAGTEQIVLNLTALPSDGGSAITALQYRLDGGAAVTLSGTGTGSRTISGLTGGVEYDVQVRAVNAVGNGAWSDTKSRTPTAAATAPAAFTSGQWSATAGVEEIAFNILALPSNGGSAITALQFRVDGGSPISFTGTGTGVRTISGFTGGVEVDTEIRAVNAVGNGPWSDVKARTPTASGGGAAAWLGVTSVVGTLTSGGTTPAKPSGTAATDLLVMNISMIRTAVRAGMTVPAGWTFQREVYSDFDGLGVAVYTAAGNVTDAAWTSSAGTTVAFDLHRVSGANLAAPVRDWQALTSVDWPNFEDDDMPSPSATASEGDLIMSHYLQPQSSTAVGASTGGYFRRVNSDTPNRRSTLTMDNAPAGATGSIAHGGSSAYEGRTSSTLVIAAA